MLPRIITEHAHARQHHADIPAHRRQEAFGVDAHPQDAGRDREVRHGGIIPVPAQHLVALGAPVATCLVRLFDSTAPLAPTIGAARRCITS